MPGTFSVGLQQGIVWTGPALCFGVAYRLLRVPDLTVEGSYCLGAAVYASLVSNHLPPSLAAVAAVASGAAAGSLTGFIHRRLKVNAFLSGIIVVAMLYSITLRVMSGPNISLLGLPGLGLNSSEGQWLPAEAILLLGLVLLLALTVTLLHSPTGIHLRVAGANPALARRMGVNSTSGVIAGLAICNSFSALSGAVMADQNGFADISLGQGVIIVALASLTIGERIVPVKALSYCTFVPLAAAIGSVVYALVSAAVLRIGVPATEIRLATGLIVLGAVALGRNTAHSLNLSGEADS